MDWDEYGGLIIMAIAAIISVLIITIGCNMYKDKEIEFEKYKLEMQYKYEKIDE